MASIVIYDSGVGGLTVYQEIVKQCSNHQLIFVSDNDAFPYGTKSEEDLITRVLKVVAGIAEKYAPDVLVVACNTASTVVLPILRERFDFSVVGVVPAIKPAAQLSSTKHICLLATPATIVRPYTNKLINEFASDCEVLKIGSTDLVNLAEAKLLGQALDLRLLNTIIDPVTKDTSIDVLILACTHFPILKNEIAEQFVLNNRQVTLIDSGLAIAQRVVALIARDNDKNASLVSVADNNRQRLSVFTKEISNNVFLQNLKDLGFSDLSYLDV